MKTVKGRTQGTWAHPALYEIGRVIGHCVRLKQPYLKPCQNSDYIKRDEWCENCVARAALDELGEIVRHVAGLSDSDCGLCQATKKYVRTGAENDRKYGIGAPMKDGGKP